MISKLSIAITTVSILILSACAKSSSEIVPLYASPLQYRSYDCEQIEMELASVSRRLAATAGAVDKTASGDKMQTAVGVVLFWPTLFLLDGDTPQAAEYARLLGEFEAIETMGRQKKCGIEVKKEKNNNSDNL